MENYVVLFASLDVIALILMFSIALIRPFKRVLKSLRAKPS